MNNPPASSLKKNIHITGASTGIGFGAAGAFARAGYIVIATVRSKPDAGRLVEQLSPDVHPVLCDVTNPEQVAALPARVRELTGNEQLDGLINNAGIVAGPGPVEFQKMADIRAQFEVNVFGLMAVTMALLPLLGTKPDSKNHAGRIINISSVGGLIASPYIAAYAATKHAVEAFHTVCGGSCGFLASRSSSSGRAPSKLKSGTRAGALPPIHSKARPMKIRLPGS